MIRFEDEWAIIHIDKNNNKCNIRFYYVLMNNINLNKDKNNGE